MSNQNSTLSASSDEFLLSVESVKKDRHDYIVIVKSPQEIQINLFLPVTYQPQIVRDGNFFKFYELETSLSIHHFNYDENKDKKFFGKINWNGVS